MARQPREWGNNQIAYPEDEMASWMQTDDLARNVQVALKSGDIADALINSGDIRTLAARRLVASGQARKGEYEERK